MDQRVQKVISVMEDGFGQRLSVPLLAEAVNLSSWRLCHLFKSETKMAPLQYLRVMRMEQAKRLLESTFLSVKQIMTEVGVRDESHFVKDFRRRYGLSPAKFRRQFLAKRREVES
jgi:transcriptional regulator GlxA family with amidase domain